MNKYRTDSFKSTDSLLLLQAQYLLVQAIRHSFILDCIEKRQIVRAANTKSAMSGRQRRLAFGQFSRPAVCLRPNGVPM